MKGIDISEVFTLTEKYKINQQRPSMGSWQQRKTRTRYSPYGKLTASVENFSIISWVPWWEIACLPNKLSPIKSRNFYWVNCLYSESSEAAVWSNYQLPIQDTFRARLRRKPAFIPKTAKLLFGATLNPPPKKQTLRDFTF